MPRTGTKLALALTLLLAALPAARAAGTRIKDITEFEGARPNQLTGIGLVVGLDNTGGRSLFTQQIAVDLQVQSARIRRTGHEVHRLLVLGIASKLGWLPTAGWNDGALPNLVLPVTVLALPQIAIISRLTHQMSSCAPSAAATTWLPSPSSAYTWSAPVPG